MNLNMQAFAITLSSFLLVACQGGEEATQSEASAPADTTEQVATELPEDAATFTKPLPDAMTDEQRSPGKPTAPVRIRYEVMGKALVGQPVGVRLELEAAAGDQPIRMHYRVNDTTSMTFPESQPQVFEARSTPKGEPMIEQVTVIPQREGRLYLNVSAQVQTSSGMMIKSTAIPIQVGAAPAAREVNGELVEDSDGEQVISMPATETEQ